MLRVSDSLDKIRSVKMSRKQSASSACQAQSMGVMHLIVPNCDKTAYIADTCFKLFDKSIIALHVKISQDVRITQRLQRHTLHMTRSS